MRLIYTVFISGMGRPSVAYLTSLIRRDRVDIGIFLADRRLGDKLLLHCYSQFLSLSLSVCLHLSLV